MDSYLLNGISWGAFEHVTISSNLRLRGWRGRKSHFNSLSYPIYIRCSVLLSIRNLQFGVRWRLDGTYPRQDISIRIDLWKPGGNVFPVKTSGWGIAYPAGDRLLNISKRQGTSNWLMVLALWVGLKPTVGTAWRRRPQVPTFYFSSSSSIGLLRFSSADDKSHFWKPVYRSIPIIIGSNLYFRIFYAPGCHACLRPIFILQTSTAPMAPMAFGRYFRQPITEVPITHSQIHFSPESRRYPKPFPESCLVSEFQVFWTEKYLIER